MKSKFDTVIKVIIVILIAVFLGLSFLTIQSTNKKTLAMAQRGTGQGVMPPQAQGMPPQGNSAQISSENAKIQANSISVSVKKMERETIQSTIKVTGDISSTSEINIYPDTSGKITRILKNIGQSVSKGEIIAYIDPSKPGSAYAANPVIATISGTIIDLPKNIGDTVNNSTTIATIGSLTDLKITTHVAEKYSAFLKPNLPAYVSISSNPEKFEATTFKISPVVNKTNRTILVELKFDKYNKIFKPGMFATVDLVIQEEKNTFVIPKKAIKNFNNKSTVFIVDENNQAKRVEITTGISNDSDIAVTSGLEKGMQVITAGSVTEGSFVKIVGSK
ncbi:MAG: efflux RND transporter periplasmic adaptor subunit [Spirochaetaceae bacterium]|nr:efflux RND transporter periplasmic adaptor subunit [Spirochaetaceae bacterium]